MQSRGSSNGLSGLVLRSRLSALMLSMFATIAAVYVAGRLWQDAENRVYLIQQLDRVTGRGRSAISVDDTLKIINCKEQQKKLYALEMELAAARQEGFASRYVSERNGTHSKRRLLAVIGIVTRFGRKDNRDAIRRAWMHTGAALKKLEDEKGIVVRFVIGRSANQGDSLDRDIDNENRQTNDFMILDNHVEAPEELPKKAKLFFVHAVDTWDAEFYAKPEETFCGSSTAVLKKDDKESNSYEQFAPLVSDCVAYFFLFRPGFTDALGAMLSTYLDKPRVYIGCMKSGEVLSEPSQKWYEPDWWKFGDKKSYFRHASGEIYVISRALAQFISINRSILRTYAYDDITVGSWLIALDVKYIDEGKFCCSSWSSGAICAAV